MARDVAAVELAILFHDIVYNANSKQNEQDSADIARSTLRMVGVGGGFVVRVAKLIMATQHDPRSQSQTNDEKIIVDLDLAILGAETESFDKYEEGIRAEYAHVSNENFARGRSEILQGFLRRERILYTDYFHKKFESHARANLKKSIARLKEL